MQSFKFCGLRNISEKLNGDGLIGLLRQIDKTFQPIIRGGFRACNADNFMVDLVSQPPGMMSANKILFNDEDIVAAEAPGLQWLCNSPKIKTIALDEKGFPFPIEAVDPRAFAIHKAWLSHEKSRSPVKKQRDFAQAYAVAEMVVQKLPNMPFSHAMSSLHQDARRFLSELPVSTSPSAKFTG